MPIEITPLRKFVKVSTIVHVALLGGVLIFSALAAWCAQRALNRTNITFVQATVAIPPQGDENKPPDKKEPDQKKPPEIKKPNPDLIAPVHSNRIQIVKSTNVIVRNKNTDKGKNLGLPQTDIPGKGPFLSLKEIRALLAAGAKIGENNYIPPGGITEVYFQNIQQTMLEAWMREPAPARAGLITEVKIRIRRDGTIVTRNRVRGSGNAYMDDSVMRAVNSVARVRPPPPGFPDPADITIIFDSASRM